MFVLVAFAGCVGSEPVQETEVPEAVTPEVSISWSPVDPEPKEAVTFQYEASHNVTNAEWVFGDGTSAVADAPSHAFFRAGHYTVELRAMTEHGIAESSVEVTVESPDLPAPPKETPAPPTEPAGPVTIESQVDENVATFSFAWNLEPTAVSWDFGDGTTSSELEPVHKYAAVGTYSVSLQVASGSETAKGTAAVGIASTPFEPHVIVGIPDSGANPYHEEFYRPERTAHPCTYIEDFPCSVKELPLSVGPGLSYEAALAQDEDLWSNMEQGMFYWVPKTSFVAFGCETGTSSRCGLDDASQVHGTGTTGSVQTEAPDALLAFKEGGSGIQMFLDRNIPVDIFSVSWGWVDPVVGVSAPLPFCGPNAPLYVKSSGNTPGLTTLPDCWTSHPSVMSIGGAYAQDNTQHATAGKEADFVSYFCRPAATTGDVAGERNWCGTSFAAPTAAGAMAKALLTIRQDSDYLGTIKDGEVSPGISVEDFRTALELTASYNPEPSYSNTHTQSIPLNPLLPCAQWGWGFLDGKVADATISHLRGETLGEKSVQCTTYMQVIDAAKEAQHG